ncbi:hypothetical protein [Corynebacterium epidermidicanis]|uniref:Uncharacterized protein n=1 Tax=Corynebacterium epidermidicanis TaxID=1050174 RepID=A0A0G3GMH1_9CORY|nr:hypothetical protein [Corynebacterium epidermidicanis]AKK02339.1 hypothetical protein CEPID_02290 [Corynebacterium epidermidicanis]
MTDNNDAITLAEAITDQVLIQLVCHFPASTSDFPNTVTVDDLQNVAKLTGTTVSHIFEEAETIVGQPKDRLSFSVR